MADIPRVARWRQRNRDAGKQAMTLWLSAEDKARLLTMAQQQHTSPSTLVAEALKAYQPVRPQNADMRQIRLLIQELLSDQLPRMVRQTLSELGIVTETPAETVTDTSDTVTATDTDTVTPSDASVTEMITESSQIRGSNVTELAAETRGSIGVTEPAAETVTETPVHPDLAEEVLEMLTGVTYDASRYKLGKLCRRGHDYEGTGQSLLYRRNSVCVACDREKVAERRAAKRGKESTRTSL
jgi:hypothetical protein